MAEKKRPGDDSLSTLNNAAEVNEMDYKEGQRRKAGQMSEGSASDSTEDQ